MVNYFPIILAVFFGTIPAILWLWFFLAEDKNPESKKTIIEVFLYGMLFALITLYALYFIKPYLAFFLLIIIPAFSEEITKYLAFRFSAHKHHELDEPVDFMIYLITAALGFAAMENILMSFSSFLINPGIMPMFVLNIIRFMGATFLHALVSAILGYFIALSFYNLKNKIKTMITGFVLATFLHILFNLTMIKIIQATKLNVLILYIFLLAILMIGMLIFIFKCFKKLKKLKSICQMNS
ncbi:MAG: PrsW family glutamic-type intramembrane protease [Candidatus Pacebacteria bacterium]|nr:PrsW family glutamic-type intramembrane protease [Candidatus Paceibacterota bacterium]